MLLTSLFLEAALAGDLPSWSRFDFPSNRSMAGRDGWSGGFEFDEWYGANNGRLAASSTDYNNSDSSREGYGSGWPADNWLIRGEDLAEGGILVEVSEQDDDTVGVVFRHDGDDTFYLLGWSADSAPPPVNFTEEGLLFLLRVEDGEATIAASVPADFATGGWAEMSLRVNDNTVTGDLGGIVLTWTDSNPLPGGQAGFYAYDSGWDGGPGATNAWFDSVEMFWTDDDDDGVPDDVDNCESEANLYQSDEDFDNVGDACDPDFTGPNEEDPTDPTDPTDPDDPTDPTDPNDPTDPTDPNDPSDTDSSAEEPGGGDPGIPGEDAGADTDSGIEPIPGEGLTAAGCGCSSLGFPGVAPFALPLALALTRRRRSPRHRTDE